MAKAKITRNYQVTIPEEVRRKVKLAEGDTVEIEAVGAEQVLLKRIIPLEELEGVWANDPSIDKSMEEVGELWESWKIQSEKKKRKKSA
ncbi:MAG TPA: AbrB/MazE/SpoVT family DNA-binding domain-containing protein [Nitrososphaerales archaeon]|nr:AbrB/MazE/SpoVT family DNA-binding domain-containing protein [Nitrososphaerales archaeon]